MSTWRDRAVVAAYRAGWAAVRALPERAAYALFHLIAALIVRRDGKGVRRLRANYAKVRPELGSSELDVLVREGMRAYLRYFCEAFRLPAMSQAEVDLKVAVEGDAPVREELAAGRPVLFFLGHMGNWDLAGAWGTRALAPVVTVAERLQPEALFTDFLTFRQSLGMTILPLTGAGDPFARLRAALAGPVLVPLLADRDLTGGGVVVDFCGHPASMAVGPAALAAATGAALFPVSIRHERRGRGWGIVIHFHDRVPVPETGSTRAKAQVMTQVCADTLGGAVRAHTADWHMLQRVFTEDLT